MKGKTLLTLALALTMTLSLAACSSGGSASVPAPDASAPMAAAPESALTPKLVEDGVLKVAMECAYAPFNWTQADDSNGAVPISGTSDYAYGYDVMFAKKIAEHLGYPQVTYGLEAEVDGDLVKVKKEMDDGAAVIGVKMPCVVTFTKPAWDPRYPTIKRKMAANKAEIPTLTAADLPSIDLEHAGLKGSPTKVKKTFVPQKKSGGVKIKEETNEDSAKKLCQLLSEAGII